MKYNSLFVSLVALSRGMRSVLNRWIARLRTLILKKVWGINCGSNVTFFGKTIIRSYERNAITIGDNCQFLAGSEHNLVGLINPTIICAVSGAQICIGHASGFSSVVMHAKQSISLGSYLNVGGNVRIFDHDFHPIDWKDRRPPQNGKAVRCSPVVIEDDVFIGTNAIILKGTHIGARSIVAAGSVVFGLDVPPDSMVKGNPAVIIGRQNGL